MGVHGVLPWTAADCGGFVCFRRVHLGFLLDGVSDLKLWDVCRSYNKEPIS